MSPDYGSWLSKEAAAEALGVTIKGLRALAQRQRIGVVRWRRPTGGPRIVVYDPVDVARVAQEGQPGPAAVILAAGQPVNGYDRSGLRLVKASDASAPNLAPVEGLRLTLAEFREVADAVAVSRGESRQSRPVDPSYVPKAEALAIAGVSDDELRKAVKAGEVRKRGLTYRRKDLEAL